MVAGMSIAMPGKWKKRPLTRSVYVASGQCVIFSIRSGDYDVAGFSPVSKLMSDRLGRLQEDRPEGGAPTQPAVHPLIRPDQPVIGACDRIDL